MKKLLKILCKILIFITFLPYISLEWLQVEDKEAQDKSDVDDLSKITW